MEPSLVLYVESPLQSAPLYAHLLGRAPAESAPGFVLFPLASGGMLGLWARAEVAPAATSPGGAEVLFQVADAAAVRAAHADWSARGLRVAEGPTQLDFGYTFVALDPDGHRLRVFAPPA